MKQDKFDYFLGLQSKKDNSFSSYILIDLSWKSPPNTATDFKGAYQLLTNILIVGNKKVLFSKVPDELASNKPKDSTINKIIENIETEKEIKFKANQREYLFTEVKEYFQSTSFSPIPPKIITKMCDMYNKDVIKHSTTNPFLYQPP